MFSTKTKLMDSKVITGTTTTYSNTFDIQNYHGCSIQIAVSGTGTLAGSVKCQASNDNSVWVDVNIASQSLAGVTPLGFNLPDLYYSLLRVVVTSTGGTSTLTITGVAKEY